MRTKELIESNSDREKLERYAIMRLSFYDPPARPQNPTSSSPIALKF